MEKKIQKDDPIDSEKYVELGEAADEMFERYLWFLDEETFVEVVEWIRNFPESLKLSLNVEAAEVNEEEEIIPGTDKEHPLILSENRDGAYNIRVDIYKYFLKKLTFVGEKNNAQGVWINPWYFATHCHNVFLQIAYDFGIIIGIMYIIIVLMLYIRVLIGLIRRKSGSWYYRLFVSTIYATVYVVFGMFENVCPYGQLVFTMFFIAQYVVYHKGPEKPQVEAPKEIESEPETVEVPE